jgi:hypothetical protein
MALHRGRHVAIVLDAPGSEWASSLLSEVGFDEMEK